MRLFLIGTYMILLHAVCAAAPIVQKIVNDTDFGFLILYHGDTSECSLHDKCKIIEPRSVFNYEFLLEVNTKGLVLRPVFYKDFQENKVFWLTDQKAYAYDDTLIQQAHENWLLSKIGKRYKYNSESWMRNWVGSDISVTFDPLEFLGYLLYLSRVRIANLNYNHTQWLSFAKGIFSKLMLELQLSQAKRGGILGKIFVLHGQGGICNNGIVERI
ncbi:hypothetical protein HYV10_01300 [Candidatus Dependentiae bacterium]|nr:hypothetical protein [Candidatus Dependentiae bacterium]